MLPTDPPGLTQRAVTLPTGVTLNVMERPGSGTPVVCLHGIWDWWRYFRPLVTDDGTLSGRQLVMLDLRGHGESSKPDDPSEYGWDDYAADVTALIRQEGYARVTLLGHSLGALTALLVAAELPERVETLILEDPPLPLASGPSEMFRGVYEMKQQSFEQIVDDFSVWRPWLTRAQAEEVATCVSQTANAVFEATLLGVSGDLVVPVPGVEIPAPTLVIRAGDPEQRALRDGGPELLAAVLPNLRLETIPGTSHTVLRDDSAAYRALLTDFLVSHG
jgi:pimeloyl-ACP methyl ester carboxylesterase